MAQQTMSSGLKFVVLDDDTQIRFTTFASPLGELTIVGTDGTLTGLYLSGATHQVKMDPAWIEDRDAVGFAQVQLGEYFAGERKAFDLNLSPAGTRFQERVWRELCKIPYGATCSYGELATAVGSAGASRAVGSANGRNPIAVIIPCHRVVAADGGLGGYGGGLERKKVLLDLERSATKI